MTNVQLRELREALRLSQLEAATLVGVSVSLWSKLEQGSRTIKPKHVYPLLVTQANKVSSAA